MLRGGALAAQDAARQAMVTRGDDEVRERWQAGARHAEAERRQTKRKRCAVECRPELYISVTMEMEGCSVAVVDCFIYASGKEGWTR